MPKPTRKPRRKAASRKPDIEEMLLSVQALLTTAITAYKVVKAVIKQRKAKRRREPPSPPSL